LNRQEASENISFHVLDDTLPAIGEGNVGETWDFEDYPRLVKTHLSWNVAFRGKKSILLIRDPRDVMVSYFHLRRDRKGLFDGDFSTFIRSRKYGLPAWFNHYHSWVDKATFLLQYEELKSDTFNAYSQLLRHLGVKFSEERLKRAIQQSSIEKVRAKDSKAKGSDNEQVCAGEKKKDKRFARSGKSKQWVDYFSKSDLAFYRGMVLKENNFTYS
jgi:hypothetical protein